MTLLLLLLPYLLGLPAVVHAQAPQVKIGDTILTGQNITELKLDFFGAIPYAQPPVGDLRLKPPVLKTRLDVSTFDASKFGSACLQPAPFPVVSEDCLTVNVFRPSGLDPSAKIPVMVWILGGGFHDGFPQEFNASAIVAQSVVRGTPVIYLNFGYRIASLGFPQGQEAADRGALNLGLKDCVAVLEWVQENIGNFGGDKEKVTVFAESSGAIMTSILLLNSPSPIQHLARAAILQSGSAASSPVFNASHREIEWQEFVSGVHSCASLAKSGNTFDCLKAASSTEIAIGVNRSIAISQEVFQFVPVLDGPGGLLPDLPSVLINAGRFAPIPTMVGTNLDEGTLFTSRTELTTADLHTDLIANFSPPLVDPHLLQDVANKLLVLYPDDPASGSPFNTGGETFGLPSNYKRASALLGDLSFNSLRRNWNQATSKAGVKTFGYLFTQPQPHDDPSIGVSHGSEVPFVYGAPPDKSASAVNLSRIMVDYWLSFVTSLDPNDGLGNARPNWTQYTPGNEVLMQLNAENLTVIPDDYRREQIEFINSYPTVFRH